MWYGSSVADSRSTAAPPAITKTIGRILVTQEGSFLTLDDEFTVRPGAELSVGKSELEFSWKKLQRRNSAVARLAFWS